MSVFSEETFASDDPAGYVLRFQDTTSGAFDLVASNNGDRIPQAGEIADLHNPEGIVFGPDGRLYVTTFRVDALDNKILVVDVNSKRLLDSIPLGSFFAQALLFGPDDNLYVPISGGGSESGSVRTYDVTSKEFQTLIPASGSVSSLTFPWYTDLRSNKPCDLGLSTVAQLREPV